MAFVRGLSRRAKPRDDGKLTVHLPLRHSAFPLFAVRACLVMGALALLVAPNVIWIWLDQTVWPWDQAWYGKHSVDLFTTLLHAPSQWVPAMLDVLGRQAPGIAWTGQFFVPVGLWSGSIDTGLLLSIVAMQAVALSLTSLAVWELSGRKANVVATGLIAMSSAPLFVALSHYYLVEMMQTAAVAWLVFIMARARSWSRPLILGQLALATSVAMLAKVSSPLFCFGPGLVALSQVVVSRSTARPRDRLGSVVTAVVAIPITIGTVLWYRRNLDGVIAHVSLSSKGPVAELYGQADQILPSLKFWLGGVAANFFSPFTLAVSALTLAAAIGVAVSTRRPASRRFAIAGVVAGVQIAVGLFTFSLSSNRDTRYLLPLLPYFVVLLCWAVSAVNRRLVTVVVMAAFALQWTHVHAQALSLLPKAAGAAAWLNPANRDPGTRRIVDALVRRTCVDAGPGRPRTAIGVQLIWMNAPAMAYAASKLAAPRRVPCDYDAVAYYDADLEAAWARLSALHVDYYVGIDGSAYAIPDTAIDRTLNQLNAPLLERVAGSGLFRREAGIPEHDGILVYKRIDRVATGRALSDRGQHDDAIAELTRATALEPANVEAWAALAFAYERQGAPEQAIAAGTEARRLSPGHYYVILILARSSAKLGRWADARAAAEDAALNAPGVAERVNALVLAADASFAAGDGERGCTLLRRARALTATPDIGAAIAARGCPQ